MWDPVSETNEDTRPPLNATKHTASTLNADTALIKILQRRKGLVQTVPMLVGSFQGQAFSVSLGIDAPENADIYGINLISLRYGIRQIFVNSCPLLWSTQSYTLTCSHWYKHHTLLSSMHTSRCSPFCTWVLSCMHKARVVFPNANLVMSQEPDDFMKNNLTEILSAEVNKLKREVRNWVSKA